MVRSTEQRIREEAGLMGNSDIKTTTIEKYQLQSYNIILGALASKYNITYLTTGYSEFGDSQAQSYLQRVEELMAAGYVLKREYQEEDENKSKGAQKIKDANDLLNALFRDKFPVRLVDANGIEIERVAYSSAGAPESTGMLDFENKFTIDDVF